MNPNACAPEINADAVARKKREEDKIAFLRQCAIGFVASTPEQVNALAANGRRMTEALVVVWSSLFDAIEATRSSK